MRGKLHFSELKEYCTKKSKKKIESKCPCGKILTSSSVLLFKDVVDFLKGLSPNELTGVRELQRRDLLHRASIYVNMVDNNSLDNYGKFFLMFFFLQNFTGIFHRLINYLSQLRSNIVLSSILVKILDGLAIILLVIVQHYTVFFSLEKSCMNIFSMCAIIA